MSRYFGIERWIDLQRSFGQRFQLVSTPLGNNFSPQGYRPLGDAKGFGKGCLGSKISNRDRFQHSVKV